MTRMESALLTIDEVYAAEWADVAYVRISDDRSGENSSPLMQRRKITEEARNEGRVIEHWFEDLSKSASKPEVVRDGFDDLLKACLAHPIQRVWVLHDDRLVRDGSDDDKPRVIKAMGRQGRKILIRCIEANDLKLWTASGRMTFGVVNEVNAYESARKGERVADFTLDRARKGRPTGGGRRLGYEQLGTRMARKMDEVTGEITEITRPSGKLTLVRREAAAIRWAYTQIGRGATLESVVRAWRAHGIVGPKGAPITAGVVRDVLMRPMNAGLSAYKGKIVGESQAPGIVSPETYHGVRAILTHPSRRAKVGNPATSLLAPVLRCSVCLAHPERNLRNGSNLSARTRVHSKAEGSKRDLIYGCRHGHVSRMRAPLDKAIQAKVLAHIASRPQQLQAPVEVTDANRSASAVKAQDLRDKIAGWQARAAETDPDDLGPILRDLRTRLAVLDRQFDAVSDTPATNALLRTGDIYLAWSTLATEDKRTVIGENIDHIIVGPGERGRGRNNTLVNITIVSVDGTIIAT